MATMTMTTRMPKPRTTAPRVGLATSSDQTPGRVSTQPSKGSTASGSIRITRRGRLVVTLAAAAGLTAAIMATSTWISPAPAVGSVATATYVVQPGDTWWSVASHLKNHGDIRQTVTLLQTLNSAQGGQLVAGAQIHVPRGSR